MSKTAQTVAAVLFLILAGTAGAQVREAWVARYNGPGSAVDEATALAVDAAGNVYVTGASAGSGTGSDYATIKYDSAGAQQWVARYNGPGNGADKAYALAVDAVGNVYVTGYSTGDDTYWDYATIKYDPTGAQKWVARYDDGPGSLRNLPHVVAVDAAGNVYVTGYSKGSGTGWSDYATIKYNSAGAQQWVARYDGPGSGTDVGRALALDAAGNVYVAGYSFGSGDVVDYATIKYNSAGVEQWVARYDESYEDLGFAMALDAAGNVYVTGYSVVSDRDYLTIKHNGATGAELWVARYNGPVSAVDEATALALDAAGNVYVTGGSMGSTGVAGYDCATIKYDTDGKQEWVRRYDGPASGGDFGRGIAADPDGNVYVTGYSAGIGTGYDYATIKYNSAGAQQWVARYNGPGSGADAGWTIALDAAGNVYVTGYSTGVGTGYDYATIKYTPVSGVEECRMPCASRPALGATIVRGILVLPEAPGIGHEASSVLLDMTGRKTAELVPGANDLSGLAPGVYFVRSETGVRPQRVVIAR